MTSISVASPLPIFFETDGSPLESGYIYIGTSNLNPLIEANRVSIFADLALTIPIAQPIRTLGGYPVVSGAATRFYVNSSNYSIVVLDKNQALVYSILNATNLSVLSSDITYPQTALEAAVPVVPINYSRWPSPVKDISRFVTDNTGVTDVSAQFAQAVAAEKNLIIPQGTYNLGTTGLVLPTGCNFTGAGRRNAIFTYSGGGVAIDGFGKSGISIEGIGLNTSGNAAATGLRFGNGAQQIYLNNIEMIGNQGAGNTGIGMLLDGTSAGPFSGNLLAQLFYCLGYKFGIKCTGTDVTTTTWTSMSFLECYLLGRGGGIIAGARGLWFDAFTNGVGSEFKGGTIEGFDHGLVVETGGFGLDFCADIEGNNVSYSDGVTANRLGSTFAGRLKLLNSTGNNHEASANGLSNRWSQQRLLNGVSDQEFYDKVRWLLYDDNGSQVKWGVARGAASKSYISGTANPTDKFYINMGTAADAVGARNFMYLNGQKVHWDNQSPQVTGLITAAVGDVCFNSAAAVDQPKGWTCTVAGTPGTWVSQGNL